ncbi:heme ABC transporter permease [Colwellia sp. M166]|mgnify:FL=1|uniref:heme ABC transporter permease n=1 Tax=Colwellia sp. M166 TaxID=2583805 RepID=UPI00211E61C7|nr:heme ABC transporter permease [Colwellia sp. M166]UUO25628.1 heme ABC transporter permease [Colwellia sp. M166]|tara:strand:+ start:3378 stop:4133 length:756 start_codon:yes stop_codon:yes gene_type:complete
MWKWLHPYANPEISYHFAGKILPWCARLAFIFLSLGIVWALLFAPADYQQGDTFRIFYLHVPAAMLSMGIYLGMAIAALSSLVWQLKLADASAAAMAPIGAAFTFIALVTGAAWGKPMWGTWWIWDARLTSELILLFLYLGVIALHNAFEDKSLAGKAAGILALVGVINLPIIKYSVEWWNTLHQGATVSKLGQPSMTADMFWPFLICFIGFAFLVTALICLRFRTEVLNRNSMRPWVRELVANEEKTHAV